MTPPKEALAHTAGKELAHRIFDAWRDDERWQRACSPEIPGPLAFFWAEIAADAALNASPSPISEGPVAHTWIGDDCPPGWKRVGSIDIADPADVNQAVDQGYRIGTTYDGGTGSVAEPCRSDIYEEIDTQPPAIPSLMLASSSPEQGAAHRSDLALEEIIATAMAAFDFQALDGTAISFEAYRPKARAVLAALNRAPMRDEALEEAKLIARRRAQYHADCNNKINQETLARDKLIHSHRANEAKEIADLIDALKHSPAPVDKFKDALERIAMLDEADGHELKESHAFEAVAIATTALDKHPSTIFFDRLAASKAKAGEQK